MIVPSHLHLLNGTEPTPGQVCAGFKLIHFYENGQITDVANVAYFKFDGAWHRICLEASTVFWRCDDPPQIPENSDLSSGLILNDLSGVTSVVGHNLDSLKYEENEDGVIATVYFTGGGSVVLRYLIDLDCTEILLGS